VGNLTPPQTFEKLLNEKGYGCRCSISRKNICDRFGIKYQKVGREIWYYNELYKIPPKLKKVK
jgi:hypothetical protein